MRRGGFCEGAIHVLMNQPTPFHAPPGMDKSARNKTPDDPRSDMRRGEGKGGISMLVRFKAFGFVFHINIFRDINVPARASEMSPHAEIVNLPARQTEVNLPAKWTEVNLPAKWTR